MATLKLDPRNGMWLVRFRFDGQQFQRSCRTSRKAVAVRVLATVEDTIELLNTGRLAAPECEDLGKWILSGGKSNGSRKAQRAPASRFGAVCDAYFADQKQKAPATLHQETTHIGHLKRLLKTHTPLPAITLQLLKRYSEKRSKEKFRAKHVSSKTIRKELTTFRQIWIWAQRNGRVERTCPLLGPDGRWEVHLEKPKQALKFQTWSQIERRITRGGLTEAEICELWRSLFLDESEVSELLKYVKDNASHAFQYAMYVFAAYTGARRSEICRSQIDDFDFEQNQVLIRERKRRKNLSGTVRFVPLHPKLRAAMEEWLDVHPGGAYTIAAPLRLKGQKPKSEPVQLKPDSASGYFKRALGESKWSVLGGFHVLRHSFGSNLARSGKVSSSTIGKWMGHSTEEMRELYQHLFPQDGVEQISVLR